MYFSYTSFSDINYRLYPSLSCGPRRDGGRSANDEGGNTLSATLCARWCVSKDEPLFLFFPPLFLISRTGFVVWVCVHLCMRSWCICLHGVERKEEDLSACQRWVLKATRLLFEGACAPVLARLRFQVQIRKVKTKKKN